MYFPTPVGYGTLFNSIDIILIHTCVHVSGLTISNTLDVEGQGWDGYLKIIIWSEIEQDKEEWLP